MQVYVVYAFIAWIPSSIMLLVSKTIYLSHLALCFCLLLLVYAYKMKRDIAGTYDTTDTGTTLPTTSMDNLVALTS